MTFKDFNALLIRLFLGYLFTSSGLCKLTDGHFGQLIGPPLLIEQLTPHGLRTFGFFIAISQVMTGALVLSQRYSLLGLIMLVPMNLGILMVTISQNWTGTPYIDAVFTSLNLLALLYEWNTLKFLLLPEQTNLRIPSNVNQFFPNNWLAISSIGFLGLACVVSRYSYLATTLVAAFAYVLAYFNVFRSQNFPWPYRWVLVMSLLAILTITFIGYLLKLPWPINPMLLMAIPVLGTFIVYIGTMIWVLLGKKKALQKGQG
ncbi:MAG: hypothetical protein R2822_26805 [Spirosomataceae bacterium]